MQIDLLGQRTIEVTPDEAEALAAEVDALGVGDAIDAGDSDVLKVTSENATTIARALDHLRNSGQTELATEGARDSLLRFVAHSPLSYKLRSWEFEGGQERAFWSYTGPYTEQDRIVERQGTAYEVVRVERQANPLEHGILLVQTSRPN